MKANTFTVKVLRRGVITLPKALREHNRIEEGDRCSLQNLGDGVIIMHCRRSRVNEIANELADELHASGETLESMLSALREVRAESDEQS